MTRLEFTVEIDAAPPAVWDFYADLKNLPLITPRATHVEIKHPPASLSGGTRFILIVRQAPLFLPICWETVIKVWRPPSFFIDEQGAVGPFAYWHHEHLIEDSGDGRTRLRDSVTYQAPFGPIGSIADRLFIRPMLTAMFAYRHRQTRAALERARDQSDS